MTFNQPTIITNSNAYPVETQQVFRLEGGEELPQRNTVSESASAQSLKKHSSVD